MTLFNFIILFIALATLWVGVAAIVQKRTMHRRAQVVHESNHAS